MLLDKTDLPILYSFRRCPYAIRARLAIRSSQTAVELREVVLADKPECMIQYSPKATVPVLVLTDGSVIDESEDIMRWALKNNDPDKWLADDEATRSEVTRLIHVNDFEFKPYLDKYKYADRFPEHSAEYYREEGSVFLEMLNDRLMKNSYLFGSTITLADMAVFPFIRQFAFVDKAWFDQCSYDSLKRWLDGLLHHNIFSCVMNKYPKWQRGDTPVIFGID